MAAASFKRWASPPESVVAGWPSLRYPRPVAASPASLETSASWPAKNRIASSTVISRTSAIAYSVLAILAPSRTKSDSLVGGRRTSSVLRL